QPPSPCSLSAVRAARLTTRTQRVGTATEPLRTSPSMTGWIQTDGARCARHPWHRPDWPVFFLCPACLLSRSARRVHTVQTRRAESSLHLPTDRKTGMNERHTTDANRDPITGAPGSHPVGVAAGGTAGALAGAAVGSLFGPIGTLVGGGIGAVGGAAG